MRLSIFASVPLAIAAPIAQMAPAIAGRPSVEQVIAQEKNSWRAWQTKDVAFWQRHLSADHIELEGPDGPTGKDAVVASIGSRKCAVASYNLGAFTVRELDADTVLLVYEATQELVCANGKIPIGGWFTSLYEHRHGRWENVLFEHLSAKTTASAAMIQPLKEKLRRGDQ